MIDLLRSPARLFGPTDRHGVADASCVRTDWDGLSRPFEYLERGGISVTYIRHLLCLAAHFAMRKSMRRGGTAVLSLFDEGDCLSLRYDMPVRASSQQARDWTTEFWEELAHVDLARGNFLFAFVGGDTVTAQLDEASEILARCDAPLPVAECQRAR